MTLEITEEEYLAHYGILRKSGRYPWGSGKDENTRNKDFLDYVANMRKQGLSEAEIARGVGLTTTQLRASKSIALDQQRNARIIQAQRLKDTGMSVSAIGREMGINESSVRSLLSSGEQDRKDVLQRTAGMLRNQVAEKQYVDVGSGVATGIGLTDTKLATAVAVLQEEGYVTHKVKIKQLGTGKDTTVLVLAAPGTEFGEVVRNRFNIRQIQEHTEDGGRSYLGQLPPIDIPAKRVGVVYGDQGGSDADGVMYVRRGVEDVSLNGARYAQVRVSVNGTHYLKGMAVYSDNMPDGVDILFHTNKKDTGNKLDAMKAMKDDPDNPFGAIVRQIPKRDAHGNPIPGTVGSAMNIVNEEGRWDDWSRSLSAQMLSKQTDDLAKGQLGVTYERRVNQLDEIMAMSNPTVRKKLLETYADSTDAAAVHLKAAALPRQANRVILPIQSMKPDEVFAPSFRDGERVVLVRYPHGGPFEIPELTVNNRNRQARSIIGSDAKDAIGIHPDVAKRLSGADFDGDSVLVIPNNKGQIKTAPALEGLKNFDPQMYKLPKDSKIPRLTDQGTQPEMGKITNLIADMTIKGATNAELARAVRHSMVVIDAAKHELDYRQSARDNGIKSLKDKYQLDPSHPNSRAASTIITRAKSDTYLPELKVRSAREGGPVDRTTGERVLTPTGRTVTDRKTGGTKIKEVPYERLAVTKNAHELSSGTQIEAIYADHSNRLKALANKARLAAITTEAVPYSPSAKKAYSREVERLDAALSEAIQNRPLERQAQILANAVVSAKRRDNPVMDSETRKKIEAQALAEARVRTGAQKHRIEISPNEWEAIQAGAISASKLSDILDNADIEIVKQLATPKSQLLMTSAKQAAARQMLANGYTQAEVADHLGVSLTTLTDNLSGKTGK